MRTRWLGITPALALIRALRVRLSLGPRHRYWSRNVAGDLTFVAPGDSLTQGIGSSRSSRSWLGLLAAHLQIITGQTVRVENRSVYRARVCRRPALAATAAPTDLVVVCIGANDAGRADPAEFRRQIRAMCDQLPGGSIVGNLPEFQWGPRIAAPAELSRVIREVVAEFPELILAAVEHHTTGTRVLAELAGNFFDPGDRGYRRIAAAFIVADQNRALRERLSA